MQGKDLVPLSPVVLRCMGTEAAVTIEMLLPWRLDQNGGMMTELLSGSWWSGYRVHARMRTKHSLLHMFVCNPDLAMARDKAPSYTRNSPRE